MSKFTKGQWMLDDSPDEYNGNIFTYDPDGSYIGIARIKGLDYIDFKTEAQANARLITAAPKMYRLLEDARGIITQLNVGDPLATEIELFLARIDGEDAEHD